MKKTTKAFLATALVLLIAGALLTLGSFIFIRIKGIDPFGVKRFDKNEKSFEISCTDVAKNSPTSSYKLGLSDKLFTQINIRLYIGDFEINKTSEKSYIQFENVNTDNLSYSIDGDCLMIKEIESVAKSGIFVGEDGISYKGLRQILGPGRSASNNQKIILNLNENDALISSIINVAFGNIYLNELQSEQISIKNTNGYISLISCKASSKLTVNGEFTNVDMRYNTYSTATVSAKAGNVTVYIPDSNKKSSMNTVIDTWIGDITVKSDIPTTYFKLNFSSKIGKIFKNGEASGKKLESSSNLSSRITASTILGDASIDFNGENEDEYVSNIESKIEIIDANTDTVQNQ